LLFQAGLFPIPVEDAPPIEPSTGVLSVRSKASKTFVENALAHAVTTGGDSTERRIWSVRALVTDIRQQVEKTYTDLWVEGEISNCRPSPSGHIYFTLKDGDAQLLVVLFRRQAMLLRFRPADGLAVLVRGRVSVYEGRGQLQLIAETMEPRGAGALQLAFEQLKARLLAEGLFDASRKRQLPAFPKCIGIVTSPAGAVIRDIATVVRRRHARLNLLVYPATMQGAASPGTVAAGIRWFNANPSLVDVIILARGGGSIEDLAGFNDEALARAIAASELPIVSAIGHETDFTIADFVADLRAPTPSAAAELVTGAQHRIEERVVTLSARVERAGRFHLVQARHRYAQLSSESVLTRLRDGVNRRDQRLDELRLRLEGAARGRLRVPAQRIALLVELLRRQDIAVRLAITHRRLQSAAQRLQRTTDQIVAGRQARLNRAFVRLGALSPLAVLSRGYALVYNDDGTLLRSTANTAVGHTIHARIAKGTLEARVTRTQTDTMETSK
jgi:exodeoxyribonuclease VII large subunit